MSNCLQTLKGISLDCGSSLGGVKKVWIGDWKTVMDEKPMPDETTGIIGSIANSGFKPFEFRRGTASMTSTLNVDETTGANFVSTEVALVFTKMDTQKRLEMAALAVGQLAVVVKDANDRYWFLGYDDYVSASAGGAETGTAKTDRNAYTITLKTESATFPYEIQSEGAEGLEDLVVD